MGFGQNTQILRNYFPLEIIGATSQHTSRENEEKRLSQGLAAKGNVFRIIDI